MLLGLAWFFSWNLTANGALKPPNPAGSNDGPICIATQDSHNGTDAIVPFWSRTANR